MPEVTLSIGGRQFQVGCDAGQEPHLERAAGILNGEASTLQGQNGRLPEGRMLLMAGLMLADRMTELENSFGLREQRISQLEAQLKAVEEKAAKLATNTLHLEDEQTATALSAARDEASAAKELLVQVTEQLELLAAEATNQAG